MGESEADRPCSSINSCVDSCHTVVVRTAEKTEFWLPFPTKVIAGMFKSEVQQDGSIVVASVTFASISEPSVGIGRTIKQQEGIVFVRSVPFIPKPPKVSVAFSIGHL